MRHDGGQRQGHGYYPLAAQGEGETGHCWTTAKECAKTRITSQSSGQVGHVGAPACQDKEDKAKSAFQVDRNLVTCAEENPASGTKICCGPCESLELYSFLCSWLLLLLCLLMCRVCCVSLRQQAGVLSKKKNNQPRESNTPLSGVPARLRSLATRSGPMAHEHLGGTLALVLSQSQARPPAHPVLSRTALLRLSFWVIGG